MMLPFFVRYSVCLWCCILLGVASWRSLRSYGLVHFSLAVTTLHMVGGLDVAICASCESPLCSSLCSIGVDEPKIDEVVDGCPCTVN
jgi:hypothetical protein